MTHAFVLEVGCVEHLRFEGMGLFGVDHSGGWRRPADADDKLGNGFTVVLRK